MLKYTTQEIIEKFKVIHGEKYDYSKFEYLGNREKSIIICKVHGEFLQHSNSHLNGKGCKQCFYEKNTRFFISAGWKANINKRAETFIKQCKLKNPDLNFDKTIYSGKKYKVLVTCPFHGDYYTKPRLLLDGVSCKKCYYENVHEKWSKEGWMKYCYERSIETPRFYLIKMSNENEIFLKFGITTKELKVRLNKYPSKYSIEIIKNISGTPEAIWNIEKHLKSKYKPYKYMPLIKFGGSSQECLNFNILKKILNDNTMCCNSN